MFKKFGIIVAKNRALIDLQTLGLISDGKFRAMKAIAGNDENILYGYGARKIGAVPCSNMAAAAIFARLVVYSEGQPSADGTYIPTDNDWFAALARALVNAGVPENQNDEVANELVQMNRMAL